MINYTTANTENDLLGILRLQKANLTVALTQEQIKNQGFVTVTHTYDELNKLNNIEKHIIARDGDRVIAYLLAMTAASKFDLPVLVPMFELFEHISFRGKRISDYTYMVVGQVCIDKEFRGKGILNNCYTAYREHFIHPYDFAVTEIASSNQRSLTAHTRIGFKEIHRYISPDRTEWCIVLWDWKQTADSEPLV